VSGNSCPGIRKERSPLARKSSNVGGIGNNPVSLVAARRMIKTLKHKGISMARTVTSGQHIVLSFFKKVVS